MEAYGQQTVQIGESLRQLVTSPAMEAWSNQTEVVRAMERLASRAMFETFFLDSIRAPVTQAWFRRQSLVA